jgi:hypothetical protein
MHVIRLPGIAVVVGYVLRINVDCYGAYHSPCQLDEYLGVFRGYGGGCFLSIPQKPWLLTNM